MRRRGPRPVMLHLTLSQLSRSASPSWNVGSPAGTADGALVAGIAAYRRHPYRRTVADPAALWTGDDARLLDYGTGRRRDHAPAVVFVPSLVNRAYVLDLAEGNSAMRHLAGSGAWPTLLDWGWPGPAERTFSVTDYVLGPLADAAAAAAAASGGPVVLAGYCMGGLLALALALLRPELVRALALLATPWDFHAPSPLPARRLLAALPLLDPALTAPGTLPGDGIQTLFALLDPASVATKYRAFGTEPQDSDRARRFVALEDWLNDGVPLAAPVARECFGGWYGLNSTANGTWRAGGRPVEPGRLRMPVLLAVPSRDRIVPAESAGALARLLPDATVLTPQAGHIGMVAGRRAEAELWQPFMGWLRTV